MEENPNHRPAPTAKEAVEQQFLSKSHVYLLGSGPRYTIIEKVAGELAGVYYDAARTSGMTSKYKSAKLYARKNFTKFIPTAVKTLTSMLKRQDIPDLMKQEIYDALIERSNDPTVVGLQEQDNGTFIWKDNVNPFMKRN